MNLGTDSFYVKHSPLGTRLWRQVLPFLQYLVVVAAAIAASAVIWQMLRLPAADFLSTPLQKLLTQGIAFSSALLGGFIGTRFFFKIRNWVTAFVLACVTLAVVWVLTYGVATEVLLWSRSYGRNGLLALMLAVSGISLMGAYAQASLITSLAFLWGESTPFSLRLSLGAKLLVYSSAILLVIGIHYAVTSFFPSYKIVRFWLSDLNEGHLTVLGLTALLACREGFQRDLVESYVTGLIIGMVALCLWVHVQLVYAAYTEGAWQFAMSFTQAELW